MDFFKRILIALSTGYILFFFGERVFWSMPRADDTLLTLILNWLVYSLFAYMTLAAIEYFKARSVWSLFLTAALFGWLLEGIYALTTFGGNFPFPFSIPWTALAWHAPALLLGWYFMLRILTTSTLRTLFATLALGVFWGTWSLAWPINGGDTNLVTSDIYLINGLICTSLYIIALHSYRALGIGSFVTTNIEKSVLAILLLTLFGLWTVPGGGFIMPLILLPILFGILYLGLRKNKNTETEANAFALVDAPIPFPRSLILLLAPLIAALIFNSGFYMNTNIFFALMLTPLGTLMFGLSLYKVLRR